MIAVTGASGFVGSALVAALGASGQAVRPLTRRPGPGSPGGDLGPQTDWTEALQGVDCVIHCAARVHVMQETEGDALAAFRRVNTAGTSRLAEQAAELGVKRMVLVSSVKVNGESTSGANPFRATDTPTPQDAYGQSKWEAEQALWQVCQRTGLQGVVVRPPLVYGPGVRANLARLMRWIATGFPLPLARIENRRSLVALDNLVDLLMQCATHPAAPGNTFLVSDDHDLSTPDLIRRLATAMGQSPRLLPVPVSWLRSVGKLVGRTDEISRLVDSLQVDIAATRSALGWTPPVSVAQGLQKMVDGGPA